MPQPPLVPAATGGSEPALVNSRAFFDQQFRIGAWERNNGPAQTRYFMSRLVEELSAPTATYLRDNALSILDWGCAFGDGLDVLKQAFPECQITGMDFSSEAVGRARRRYPHHAFIHGETIERDFDVIVTSNCLEHFDDPLRLVETHLRSCRKLYIALVPFEEQPLLEGHVTRFGPDTFPPQLGSWTCVGAQVVDMEVAYWSGWQLLVVYGSMSFLKESDAGIVRSPATTPSYREKRAAEARTRGDHLVEAAGEWHAWLDHPMIVEHYRQRALVDGLPWSRWVRRELGGPAETSLELGCGAGSRSFALRWDGATSCVEGLDIGADRIAEAERIRSERRISGSFRVADSNTSELPAGRYGLIFSCHSFHQFGRIDHIMEQVHQALHPAGLFVLEDYVGPTQLQWTDKQIALVRSLLSLVPERLRRLRWNSIKAFEGRPTPAEVIAASPLQSIRSAEIYPLFEKYFDVVRLRKLGGTIQALFYNGIMHNFQPDDPDALSCMQAIISVEDALIDDGLLPSDFMLLIGRRKDVPGPLR